MDGMCDAKVQMSSSISVEEVLKYLKKNSITKSIFPLIRIQKKNIHVSTFGMWHRDRIEYLYLYIIHTWSVEIVHFRDHHRFVWVRSPIAIIQADNSMLLKISKGPMW